MAAGRWGGMVVAADIVSSRLCIRFRYSSTVDALLWALPQVEDYLVFSNVSWKTSM